MSVLVDRRKLLMSLSAGAAIVQLSACTEFEPVYPITNAGWRKRRAPVLGGKYGTCFDASVLKEHDTFKMWFSWREKHAIAYTDSLDGLRWREPVVVLEPNKATAEELEANRPTVINHSGSYLMWYTAQSRDRSWINFARSADGLRWSKVTTEPVLKATQSWEKTSLMSPDVLWDGTNQQFRMWYAAGDQYEPDAIGYCTSGDGISWTRQGSESVFRPGDAHWERFKVAGPTIRIYRSWHIMFYIGFSDFNTAAIGIARSRDGITNWQRHPNNPIIRGGRSRGFWDQDAVYKPTVVLDENRWMLWYNGRRRRLEQIGFAEHDGLDLGFEAAG